MGVVVNQRPELFKAVVAEVPFVDVINTMLDETLPLTVGEFIEWGNPKLPEQYAWMRAYSPYDNLKAGAYPAMLVRTGLNDTQVAYWEPAKYVARLRTLKTDANPLLLKINLEVGHGGASGRFDSLREIAEDDVFLLVELGLAGLRPSDVEEHRLVLALQADVEAVDGGAAVGCAGRCARRPGSCAAPPTRSG